nr:proline-rich protein 2-like [Aegilops tauschii subsp. strangulata]
MGHSWERAITSTEIAPWTTRRQIEGRHKRPTDEPTPGQANRRRSRLAKPSWSHPQPEQQPPRATAQPAPTGELQASEPPGTHPRHQPPWPPPTPKSRHRPPQPPHHYQPTLPPRHHTRVPSELGLVAPPPSPRLKAPDLTQKGPNGVRHGEPQGQGGMVPTHSRDQPPQDTLTGGRDHHRQHQPRRPPQIGGSPTNTPPPTTQRRTTTPSLTADEARRPRRREPRRAPRPHERLTRAAAASNRGGKKRPRRRPRHTGFARWTPSGGSEGEERLDGRSSPAADQGPP